MKKFLVLLSAVGLALSLATADGTAASKKKTTNANKGSHRAMCNAACKKAYGPSSFVHTVRYYSGKPFCWCTQ